MTSNLSFVGPARRNRKPFRAARAFFLVVALLLLITIFSYYFPRSQYEDLSRKQKRSDSDTFAEDLECRTVHGAIDKCAFVRTNCPDEQAGLITYLEYYYCSSNRAQPFVFAAIVLWLGLLFSTIGIAASDFFCINLSTIANLLGMSESLAGVTFLAFGNGSPDVFSTFAAMSTNSGSLAIGELIGAAGFITTVVAGSMAFVHPFKVAKKSFVRDVSFFIVAATFSMVFLYDGILYPWEAAFMVGIYIFYVIFVVTWHWWFSRTRRKREIEAAARAQYVVPGADAAEFPPYHDEETDGAGLQTPRQGSFEDFSALERGGIAYDDRDDDQQKEERDERALGEISRNMRVSRPRVGGRRSTYNPVRPSLIGVLEFRSVVTGLHRSGNTHNIPLDPRRYSDDARIVSVSQDDISTLSEPRRRAHFELEINDLTLASTGDLPYTGDDQVSRSRAISAPEVDALRNVPVQSQGGSTLVPPSPTLTSSPEESKKGSRTASPGPPRSTGVSSSHLAPPDYFGFVSQQPSETHSSDRCPAGRLTLTIPQIKSPTLPSQSPHTDGGSPSLHLPSPRIGADSISGDFSCLDRGSGKPLRWWPYTIAPPPEELWFTLFPTLSRWNEKSYWGKFLGVVAAPSVFFLTITLPVVESEVNDSDEKDDDIPDLTLPSAFGPLEPGRSRTNVTIVEPDSSPSLDEEAYARETRSLPHANANGVGGHIASAAVAVSNDDYQRPSHLQYSRPSGRKSQQPFPSILSPSDNRVMMDSPEQLPADVPSAHAAREWNRWLVIVQTFTAPFFIVIIVWAKVDAGDPAKLIRPTMMSLVCSLVALAVVLTTTTPTQAPKWRVMLCFLGFCVSIAWISTVADEVVGVLKTVGVILNISDAILGLTIFAVGNSLGDLVADITVAKLGYPVMALSACFGGPMLNILLGVGLSGLYLTVKDAHHAHDKHPGRKMKYKPYHIDVSKTLMISGATLLVTLVGLLVVVPLRRWKMDRVIGWGLIALWTTSTVGNVVVEIIGLGKKSS